MKMTQGVQFERQDATTKVADISQLKLSLNVLNQMETNYIASLV